MLRQGLIAKLILAAGLGLALQARAAGLDFLPAGTPAEKEFKAAFEAGEFAKALKSWSGAHGASAFGRSTDGTATLSYLLFQNGMPVVGLQNLLNNTQPSGMTPALVKMWSAELSHSPLIQKGWVRTSGGWAKIYDNSPVHVSIANARDVGKAFLRAQNTAAVGQKARIWWQIATLAPQLGQTSQALRALDLLDGSGQSVIGKDQLLSARARVLYQRNELDQALRAYHQIPKSSPLWVESVEERAWAYLRADDFDKSLGESITLLSPALIGLVGPESYFLANLLSLKACDYPRIFKNSELFKQRHKEHLQAIQSLADKGSNPGLGAALERFDKNGVSVEAAGPQIAFIPRPAFRDTEFLRLMTLRRQLTLESAKGAALGVQVPDLAAQTQSLRAQAVERLRRLAGREVAEYRQILNKMHIIEGEVIQRLAMDDNLKGKRNQVAKFADGGDDTLVFPYKSDEVWFDELDNYKARVKDCPTLKGAGL